MTSVISRYHSDRMRAEELDVALDCAPITWGATGEVPVDRYLFHCIGTRRGTRWTLHLATCLDRYPRQDHEGRRALAAALRRALERELGLSLVAFHQGVIAAEPYPRREGQPCPYRHGANWGYYPVQLSLRFAR